MRKVKLTETPSGSSFRFHSKLESMVALSVLSLSMTSRLGASQTATRNMYPLSRPSLRRFDGVPDSAYSEGVTGQPADLLLPVVRGERWIRNAKPDVLDGEVTVERVR
jgi:hypothetical protein